MSCIPSGECVSVKTCSSVQTNPSSPKDKYGKRRKAIRDTFLDSLTAVPDSETKFVVGRSTDKRASRAFAQEVSLHPDQYFHLDMEVCHYSLRLGSDNYIATTRENRRVSTARKRRLWPTVHIAIYCIWISTCTSIWRAIITMLLSSSVDL